MKSSVYKAPYYWKYLSGVFVRLLISQLCTLVSKVWCLIVLLIVEKRVCLVAKISFKMSCYVPRKLWLVNLKERTSCKSWP